MSVEKEQLALAERLLWYGLRTVSLPSAGRPGYWANATTSKGSDMTAASRGDFGRLLQSTNRSHYWSASSGLSEMEGKKLGVREYLRGKMRTGLTLRQDEIQA